MATVFPHYLSTLQMPLEMGATVSPFSLTASDMKIAWVFHALQAMTITRVGVYVPFTAGTPPTYRLRLEGVSASTGLPDGTDVGGGSPTAVTSNTWSTGSHWKTLTNSYACTRGQLLALVMEYSAGTIDLSNYIDIASLTGDYPGLPYVLKDFGAGIAIQTSEQPVFGYGSAGRRYGQMVYTASDWAEVLTTGHRAACKFNLDGNLGSTYTLLGFRCGGYVYAGGGAGTYKIGLWNAAGTELQGATYDSDQLGNASEGRATVNAIFDESSLTSLSYGTDYYVGLEHVDINVALKSYRVGHADDRQTLFLPGAFCSSTWNGSAWADDTTAVPIIELLIEEHTSGGGSGGGIRIAGRGGLAG